MNAIIHPQSAIRIDTELPGDKSISHRVAMIAAISNGVSEIEYFSTAADCQFTLNCLEQLGVHIDRINSSIIMIEGRGKFGFKEPSRPLDCGNSGTTARLLAGILAGQAFDSILTGDESLCLRPMRRIAFPLSLMGADIELTGNDNLPMRIRGKPLHGIRYQLDVPSAQVKSCLMLAGLYANSKTCIVEPLMTRDHTERLFDLSPATNADGTRTIIIDPKKELTPKKYFIPGDVSSASFLIAAGLLISGSSVILRKVSINPTRTAFINILINAGAEITILNKQLDATEPYGDIEVRPLKIPFGPLIISPDIIPQIIDEIPILAVIATKCADGLTLYGAKELRHKECDRITAIVNNLRAMSIRCQEFDDGFRVEPGPLHGAVIDSYHDHRIAMAFAVAGMAADSESTLLSTDCVSISFPEFFSFLEIKDFF